MIEYLHNISFAKYTNTYGIFLNSLFDYLCRPLLSYSLIHSHTHSLTPDFCFLIPDSLTSDSYS